jgi:hypothetical protein
MRQRATDQGDPKKYRTEIPNIVLTLGLSPYELALYVHLKRTAGGDGICWKSTATLARETGMSSGMVSKAKLTLQSLFPLLRKPLIKVSEETNPKGGKPNHSIIITDIWPENMNYFASSHSEADPATSSPHELASSYGEVASSPHEFTSSPGELRKEPDQERTQEERTLKEKDQQRDKRADTRGTRLPDDFSLNSETREWATMKTPLVNVDAALEEFCDYWWSVPGSKGRKLDWVRTFHNRLRELQGREVMRGGRGGQSNVSSGLAAAERVAARYEQRG